MRKLCWYAVLCIGLLAVGCDWSDPNVKANPSLNPTNQTGRVRVMAAQVFEDSRGYSRDIMVLRDTETGIEYLAVMGAGVTDLRRETTSNGKTTTTRTVEE